MSQPPERLKWKEADLVDEAALYSQHGKFQVSTLDVSEDPLKPAWQTMVFFMREGVNPLEPEMVTVELIEHDGEFDARVGHQDVMFRYRVGKRQPGTL